MKAKNLRMQSANLSVKVPGKFCRQHIRTSIDPGVDAGRIKQRTLMMPFRLIIAAQRVTPKSGRRFRLGDGRFSPLIVPLCLIICLSIAVCAWGDDSGYLRVVGPAPLRFRPTPRPISTPLVPPPEASPAPTMPAVATPDFSVVPNLLPMPTAPAPVTFQAPPAATTETNAVIEPPRAEEVVSPQMLLKYFNKSTNGNTTGVIAPIQFAPPQPTGAPSSTATYSN